MREIRDRQLLPLAVILGGLLAWPARAAQPTPPSPAGEELRAAKILELSVLARGAPADEQAKLRRMYADLERKYPLDASIKNGYAEFLWNIEERDQAMRRWRAAEQIDPRNAVVLNHLGGAHLAIGEVQRALDRFTRATEVEPNNPLYHFNLANVAFVFRHDLEKGDENAFHLALHHFAEASRLAPADPEYARAYAEVFYSIPNPDWNAALAAWDRFRELTTNKDFALLNLARVHMKLGQKDQARACLAEVKGSESAKLKTRLGQRIEAE
jgi:tetratricopeptide (TPR) repeat protein